MNILLEYIRNTHQIQMTQFILQIAEFKIKSSKVLMRSASLLENKLDKKSFIHYMI